ncbi:MAG: ribulose-5-phosphate 4-epimerase/fuculose-1-phosphate aldolase [Verrucomicrobiales bacterium]|jgi:ribulose-5-phosphate 4-epimerase/fuculose-1-phosphate aldolase
MSTAEEVSELAGDVVTVTGDMIIPLPPTFDDVSDEREYRKKMLIDALHVLGSLRLAEGAVGHITVRDPEFSDRFWVNPLGLSFKVVEVDDLLCVNHDGEILHGNRPLNNAAFAIHGAIHAARPDVVSACHTHAMYSKSFSALGIPLEMITQDHCMFYDDIAMHSDDGGAVVTDALSGEKMADSLGDKKALVHQNHGIITVGESVDEAAWWFVALERACQSQLLAMAAGEMKIIPDEYAQLSYQETGYSFAGWFQFQTIKQEHGLA